MKRSAAAAVRLGGCEGSTTLDTEGHTPARISRLLTDAGEAETNITTVVEPGGPNLSPLGSVSQTEPVGPEVAMARRADAENSRKGEKMPTPSGPDVTGAPGKGAGSTGNGECVDATYVLPDTLAR